MRILFIVLIFCSCTRNYYVTCYCPKINSDISRDIDQMGTWKYNGEAFKSLLPYNKNYHPGSLYYYDTSMRKFFTPVNKTWIDTSTKKLNEMNRLFKLKNKNQ